MHSIALVKHTRYIKFNFAGLGSDDEVKLIKYLFDDKNYNPLIRPVRNINESIEVQFNLALSQLISVVSIQSGKPQCLVQRSHYIYL